ncbi:MAG: hypothetical protein A3H49_09880 [Nitrospirae bacterium RIFCSPLOWO2_02_FULL_62_14]|nr:MAG: hypothetical protein A3H49_09880 [Nitrospirae bacterium RIFCSPLOWO2_02_FULL_62_14]OGW70684.1 MAG: hypothetical protein A3A88_08335 [Nitrospirae bacterium RIFCSPLOWO2_01_FULL_62_17]OGW92270.1 MAG: hypothetical protein A3K11_02750 [Nitrospirae bacterium RIFCSPLOWO2_12_FULL_63_8]
MDLAIGSNSFRNTNGVLAIHGKEQIVLEIAPESEQLLLTMDLYNASGHQVAHLRRNEWKFNLDDRFTFSATASSPSLYGGAPWLKLDDKETGNMVLEASVTDPDKVQILEGRLYTHKGQLLEITSHLCRIAGVVTMFGDTRDARGGAIVIG